MTPEEVNGWNQFLNLCRAAVAENQTESLFNFLLTPEEKQQLAMRVQLVGELLKGEKTQREIAHDLKISIAKITRGSNALKAINDDLKKFILEHRVC